MTNVLMISAYFWEPPKKYYGIFWMAVNLCRKGHKVVAISSKIHSSKDREILEGVHVYRVPAFYFSRIPWAIAFPAHLWKLMDYLVTRYKIDVVHMQELAFPCTLFAALYCKIRNLPYVATAHGSYFGLGWGLIPDLILDFYMLTAGRLTVKFAEKVSVISKGQIPILRLLGVPKEKIVFTPLGLDTDTSVFEKATEKEKKGARKWLNLKENDFVVGFVGRLAPDKNVSLLIDSVNHLSGEIPNLKLLIVGAGVEEELLRRKTAKLGLENSVLFLGWRDDVDKILPAMDVFAYPSLADGLGRAFVEAMAEGVPVVSSDVPGPSGVIVNGKNGLLVPRNNLKAMVDAILKMYENEELRKRLSAEGTKVSKVFSWDSTTSKIEATYEQARAAHQKQRRLEATEAIE